MFEIGNSLRRARERLGLELSQVEEETHIRSKYLKALEEEHFGVLPGAAYAKGFLRTYADFLGLEGERFLDEFNDRFPPLDTVDAAPLVRVRRPRRLFGARLVAVLTVISVGVFVWRLTSGGESRGRVAFAPSAPHVRLSTPVSTVPAAAPRPLRTARLTLVAARGPCWLSVRVGSATGALLYERTLQPGRTLRFVGTRIWVRLGAPWNVDATLNGKRAQLPATIGDVVVTPRALTTVTR